MVKIDEKFIDIICEKARASQRKRTNHNFHESYSDPIQRLLNAAQVGTYIRPHKHEDPDKREVFIVLRGRVVVVKFDEKGGIADHVVLDCNGGARAVEILPREWHSFITLEPDSVLYEVKDGPYTKIDDKHFASWAPEEGSPGAPAFNEKILKLLKLEAAVDKGERR